MGNCTPRHAVASVLWLSGAMGEGHREMSDEGWRWEVIGNLKPLSLMISAS